MDPTQREVPPSVLGRAVSLLDAFEPGHTVLTLAQLSRASGLPRSTAHRMCGDLVDLGLLVHSGTGYRLGPHLLRLGATARLGMDLRDVARPHMEDLLVSSGGRSVHLAVLDGVDVVYVEVMRGPATGHHVARIGDRLPAHTVGIGKVILAYSPPEVVAARIAAGLPRLTARTLVSPGSLARELASVRTNGVALDREDPATGQLCAAAPVLTVGGRVVAGLSLAGTGAHDLALVTPAVRIAARGLSRALGAFPG